MQTYNSINYDSVNISFSSIILEGLYIVGINKVATKNDLEIILYSLLSKFNNLFETNRDKEFFEKYIGKYIKENFKSYQDLFNNDRKTLKVFKKVLGIWNPVEDMHDGFSTFKESLFMSKEAEDLRTLKDFFYNINLKDITDNDESHEIKIIVNMIHCVSRSNDTSKYSSFYTQFIGEGTKAYWFIEDKQLFLRYGMKIILQDNNSVNKLKFGNDFFDSTEQNEGITYNFMMRNPKKVSYTFIINLTNTLKIDSDETVTELLIGIAMEINENIDLINGYYIDKNNNSILLKVNKRYITITQFIQDNEIQMKDREINIYCEKKGKYQECSIENYVKFINNYAQDLSDEKGIVNKKDVFPYITNKQFFKVKEALFNYSNTILKEDGIRNLAYNYPNLLGGIIGFNVRKINENNTFQCIAFARKTKRDEYPRYIMTHLHKLLFTYLSPQEIEYTYTILPYDSFTIYHNYDTTIHNKKLYLDFLLNCIVSRNFDYFIDLYYQLNTTKALEKITEEEVIVYNYPQKLFLYLQLMKLVNRNRINALSLRFIQEEEGTQLNELITKCKSKINQFPEINLLDKDYYISQNKIFYLIKLFRIIELIYLKQLKKKDLIMIHFRNDKHSIIKPFLECVRDSIPGKDDIPIDLIKYMCEHLKINDFDSINCIDVILEIITMAKFNKERYKNTSVIQFFDNLFYQSGIDMNTEHSDYRWLPRLFYYYAKTQQQCERNSFDDYKDNLIQHLMNNNSSQELKTSIFYFCIKNKLIEKELSSLLIAKIDIRNNSKTNSLQLEMFLLYIFALDSTGYETIFKNSKNKKWKEFDLKISCVTKNKNPNDFFKQYPNTIKINKKESIKNVGESVLKEINTEYDNNNNNIQNQKGFDYYREGKIQNNTFLIQKTNIGKEIQYQQMIYNNQYDLVGIIREKIQSQGEGFLIDHFLKEPFSHLFYIRDNHNNWFIEDQIITTDKINAKIINKEKFNSQSYTIWLFYKKENILQQIFPSNFKDSFIPKYLEYNKRVYCDIFLLCPDGINNHWIKKFQSELSENGRRYIEK